MTSQHLTYVHLIYQPMSDDDRKWKEICEAMPTKARVSWALRGAKDVAHLATYTPEVAACIEAIEKWLRDEISDEELNAAIAVWSPVGPYSHAVRGAAGSLSHPGSAVWSIIHAASAAASVADIYDDTYTDKWTLYKEWYWEELAKWHSK